MPPEERDGRANGAKSRRNALRSGLLEQLRDEIARALFSYVGVRS